MRELKHQPLDITQVDLTAEQDSWRDAVEIFLAEEEAQAEGEKKKAPKQQKWFRVSTSDLMHCSD